MTHLNPWESQRKLMEISLQDLPTSPELNKASILYAALILEETSELMEGMYKALERITSCKTNKVACIDDLSLTQRSIIRAGEACKINSTLIREYIANMKSEIAIPLLQTESIELADASTDIAVVNAGFMLSSGMNGAACYDEVASSNLSKANPVSGLIDKDSSGKWLKSVTYKAPDLKKVIYG